MAGAAAQVKGEAIEEVEDDFLLHSALALPLSSDSGMRQTKPGGVTLNRVAYGSASRYPRHIPNEG